MGIRQIQGVFIDVASIPDSIHFLCPESYSKEVHAFEPKTCFRRARENAAQFVPFVVFELTTNPQSPVSVKSKSELIKLFPKSYDFFVISEDQGSRTGKYELVNPDRRVHFDKLEQTMCSPIRRKKKKYLPFGNPSNKRISIHALVHNPATLDDKKLPGDEVAILTGKK